MKLSSIHALLVVAASLAAHATADFKVTPEPIVKAATSKNVKYVKQWKLSGDKAQSIDSIDLSLAGNAYVSYVSGLPTGVLGYVNVSGDSRDIVNAVTVSKDVDNDNDLDDLFDDDNNGGELNVWLGNTATGGHLLTEIFLATPDAVTDVKSQRSAQVVIEDGVLVKKSKRAELQIDSTGSSAVFVSAPKTAVSVDQLSLETKGSATIQYNVKSLYVRSELQMDAQGSSLIDVITDSAKTSQLELDAMGASSICISAKKVTTTWRDIEGKNQISFPNSAKKHGTKGTFDCKNDKLPAREAAKITASNTGLNKGNNYLDDDDKDDDSTDN